MQTEVRGLQVENRRIMDHLFGEDTENNQWAIAFSKFFNLI
ncbi:MAG: hypothetical protein AAFQ80_15890 [Cyanobacteria bacterium J06621_8]